MMIIRDDHSFSIIHDKWLCRWVTFEFLILDILIADANCLPKGSIKSRVGGTEP